MYNLYTSNRLESLCQTLAENICRSEHGVFGKEVIITQSAGMNAWLKTELAQRNGVFTNFAFENQDGFFSEIYQLLFKQRLQNNLDTLKYKIYDFLGNTAFKDTFSEVASYYENNELRRFQLSAKIADLFDQYQLYRPHMLEKWERGELSTENTAEKWQQWLWNKLNADSRSKISRKILDQLGTHKDLIQKSYPEISLFGISVYTRFHLDFFKELAKYTHVNFYLCLPTDQLQFKNELLVSFGTKAGELARMFDVKDFATAESEADSLLSRIQHQIIHNDTALEWKEDDSLQINSCYTPVREVECLYNYLLDLFEKDRGLKPGDVLVMTSDINKYAPYVKAVFRNAPVNIPFQISGAANNSDDTLTATLEQILSFKQEDLTSEKVISLLEQKRIKQRFQVEDTNYIRSVVNKANIRFGIENRIEDDTRYVSWEYGLEKILLGYAMLTDEEYPVGNDLSLYPFKDTEASGSYDLFRLKAFFSALKSLVKTQKEARSLFDWKLFLFDEILDKMVYSDDSEKDDRAELSSIYRALSFIDNLGTDEKVPFALFLEELKSRLFTESRDSKLNTGRVTISSPIPVRGIPYKVICFLGLNNDIFPRKDQFMGFDLLGEEYREGDRNKKETDKFLFLDTLLAAKENLYLSYIGQSVKDNTEIPPSIVVDTLMDYLGSDRIAVKHPLHGFSSRYQKDDKRLFTYLYSKQAKEFKPIEQVQKELTDVSVYSFVKFFEHPIEWYFKTVLGIKFEDNSDTLPETELFGLDALQKWQIKNELLRLKDSEVDSYISKSIKEGQLPLKNLGKLVVEEIGASIAGLKLQFNALIQNKEVQNIAIDLTIDNVRLTGTIEGVYGYEFVAFAFSDNLKYRVRAYLNTLLLCAADKIKSGVFLDKNGGVSNLPVFSPADALLKLTELLSFFRKGNLMPLKFTLDASDQVQQKAKTANIFKKEAEGVAYSSKPPNQYVAILLEEGCLKEFDVERFDVSIYDNPHYDEIKEIAELLNLNTVGL